MNNQMPNSKGNDFSIKQTFKADTVFQMAPYILIKDGASGEGGVGEGREEAGSCLSLGCAYELNSDQHFCTLLPGLFSSPLPPQQPHVDSTTVFCHPVVLW